MTEKQINIDMFKRKKKVLKNIYPIFPIKYPKINVAKRVNKSKVVGIVTNDVTKR
jgi:hypothetical protein